MNDETKVITNCSKSRVTAGKECIICKEVIPLTENDKVCINYGKPIFPQACDKCKEAILVMRKQLESNK